MSRKISLGVVISLIALSIAVTYIITASISRQTFNEKLDLVEEQEQLYSRMSELSEYVESYYYTDLDEDYQLDCMLKGYIKGLDDPYSSYMTAEEYELEKSDNAGTMVGIGVTVQQHDNGYILVLEVLPNSPAEQNGVEAGDIIISVDGIDAKQKGFEDAINMISGEKGTNVLLHILRGEQELDFDITRDEVDFIQVTYEMLENKIGYINISSFRDNTIEQFYEALETLVAQGAAALVFDLRDNGGGLVYALEECLDPLLPEGDVAYAEYKDGTRHTIVKSDAEELNLPMAVLVNGNTASAAELFSAALRDFGKADLIGLNTFGKGIMQDTFSLEDGSAVTLTVATYRTVVSECYHEIGLVPDVTVEDDPDTETDEQLAEALRILQGAE